MMIICRIHRPLIVIYDGYEYQLYLVCMYHITQVLSIAIRINNIAVPFDCWLFGQSVIIPSSVAATNNIVFYCWDFVFACLLDLLLSVASFIIAVITVVKSMARIIDLVTLLPGECKANDPVASAMVRWPLKYDVFIIIKIDTQLPFEHCYSFTFTISEAWLTNRPWSLFER